MDFNGTKRRLSTRASEMVGAIDPHLGAPKTWLRSGNDMQLPRALNWLRSLISMHYRINLDLSVTNTCPDDAQLLHKRHKPHGFPSLPLLLALETRTLVIPACPAYRELKLV